MADTITIDLDASDARSELDKLIDTIRESQSETEKLADAGTSVVQSQAEQMKAIRQTSEEFSILPEKVQGSISKTTASVAAMSATVAGYFFRWPVATKMIVGGMDELATKTGVVREETEALNKEQGTTILQLTLITAGVVGAIKAGAAFSESMKAIRKETAGSKDDFDRLKGAAAGAAENLTRPFAEVGPAAAGMMQDAKESVSAWFKQIGKDAYEYLGVKKAVDYGEKNLKEWGTFFENWIDEARGNFVRFENQARKSMGFQVDRQDQIDNYTQEAKALRELADWHAHMDQIRAKEAGGFKAIGDANRQVVEALKEQTRAQELAALTTEEGIKREILAIQKRAAEKVQTGLTEEQVGENARKLFTERMTLENQLTRIVEGENSRRIASAKAAADAMKAQFEGLKNLRDQQQKATAEAELAGGGASDHELHRFRMQAIEEEAEAKSAAAKSAAELTAIELDAEKKRITEVETFRRAQIQKSGEMQRQQAEWLQANSDASNQIEEARAQFRDDMELHTLKLKLDGQKNFQATTKEEIEAERQWELEKQKQIHEKKLQLIEAETDRETKAAKTKEAELAAVAAGEMKRLREMADYEKALATETANHKLQLEEKERELKKAKKDALAGAMAPQAQQILGMQTQQQQARQFMANRAKAASDAAVKESGFEPGGDLPSEIKKKAKAAEAEARKQAMKDMRTGNVSADEQMQVQKQLADKTIGQATKGGKLSSDVVAATTQAVQALATQQANTDALQRQVTQLQNQIQAVQQAGNNTRQRAQAGGMR